MKTKSSKRIWIIIALAGVIVVAALFYLFGSGTPAPAENIPTDTAAVTPETKPTPQPTDAASTASASIFSVSPVSPVSPVATAQALPKLSPEEIQTQINLAILAQDQKDYRRSVEIIDELLSKDANNSVALNVRGSGHFATGDYDQAIIDYIQSIESGPFFPHPYYNLGRVYYVLGEYEKAVENLQKSIELAPAEFNYRANGNIGLIYHAQGKYNEALNAFNQSIDANLEDKADVYFFRGETYTAQENYESAVQDYQSAIQRFPNYDAALRGLGYVYYKTSQTEQALDALNQSLSIVPNQPETLLYKALVFLVIGQPDDAENMVDQAMTEINSLPSAHKEAVLNRVIAELIQLADTQPELDTTITAIQEKISAVK